MQNAAGNVAGLIAPAITGMLVDQTGLFDVAFALAAAVNVLGLIGWVFMLPKVAPIDWARAARSDVSSRTRVSRASRAFRSRGTVGDRRWREAAAPAGP